MGDSRIGEIRKLMDTPRKRVGQQDARYLLDQLAAETARADEAERLLGEARRVCEDIPVGYCIHVCHLANDHAQGWMAWYGLIADDQHGVSGCGRTPEEAAIQARACFADTTPKEAE